MGWKTIEPNVWKPQNEGDSIEGVYIGKDDKIGDISAKYYLEQGKEMKFVWGSAVLDERMKGVKIGQLLRITFIRDEELKGGRTCHIYKVEVYEDESEGL